MLTQVPIVRIAAQPRQLSDGSLATLRMAGGGDRAAYYFTSTHWRAGVSDLPRFSIAWGWDENGWNGNARAQIANLVWSPSLKADLVAWANNYLWKDAPVTAEVGFETQSGGGGAAPTSTQWRLWITDSGMGYGSNTGIAEVEMRGTVGGGDQCSGGTASANSFWTSDPTYGPDKAFDNNGNTLWHNAPDGNPTWLQYTFGSPVTVAQLAITSRNDGYNTTSPVAWELQYHNGSSWVTLQAFTTSNDWGLGETRLFNVSASGGVAGSGEPASWTSVLTGKVQSIAAQNGQLNFTIADNGATLDQPLVKSFFAGTGGVEGPAEATGREKRRSYGYVFNVEGRILDKVNNIWEFGDPAQPLQAIVEVRDIGRPASPAPTTVAWQGSVAATFSALQAASAAAGSCVIAPSIGCVKWWTQPVGPLTADLIGAGDYGNTATTLAKHITIEAGLTMAAVPGSVSAMMANTANAGVHVADDRFTVANALDRLLLGAGVLWRFTPAGVLDIMPIDIANPVETVQADNIIRQRVFPPHRSRRVGYMRNERQMSPSELAATILSGDIGDLQSTVNGYIAPGDRNRQRYAMFEQGVENWDHGVPAGGAVINSITAGVDPTTGKNHLAVSFNFSGSGQSIDLGTRTDREGATFTVTPGERILARVGMGVFNGVPGSEFYAQIGYLDAAGAEIVGERFNVSSGGAGSVAYNTLGYAFDYVPAGAVEGFWRFPYYNNTGGAWGPAILYVTEPMVVGAGAAQTAVPGFNPGPTSEAGAQINRWIDNPPQRLTFAFDYLGAPKAGEFSRPLSFKLLTTGGQITNGVTWKGRILTGGFNGITSSYGYFNFGSVVSGTGFQNVDSLQTSECKVEVTATYLGKPYTLTITLIKEVDSPPITSGGGGGGGGSSTLDSDTSLASFGTAGSWTTVSSLGGVLPAGKTSLNISCQASVVPANSGPAWSDSLECRVLRDNGGGSYTQIGSTQSSSPYWIPAGGGEPADYFEGSFYFNVTDNNGGGGLTPGNTYNYIVQMRTVNYTHTCYPQGDPGTSLVAP